MQLVPLGRGYDDQVCSIAGALGVVGERWTLLIVRQVMLGVRRFDDIQADLGVARNVLQTRLERLVAEGILDRRLYQERPERFEYHLTDKGLDLWPIVVGLMQWGDAHAAPEGGPAVVLAHRGCGGPVDAHRTCERCGERLAARDVYALPGPGAPASHPLRRRLHSPAPAGVAQSVRAAES